MAAPTAPKTCPANHFSIVLVEVIIDFFQLTLTPSSRYRWVHRRRLWMPSELKENLRLEIMAKVIMDLVGNRLGKHQHPSLPSLYLFFWGTIMRCVTMRSHTRSLFWLPLFLFIIDFFNQPLKIAKFTTSDVTDAICLPRKEFFFGSFLNKKRS